MDPNDGDGIDDWGQYLRCFFDTVPPEQSGVPGSGPWKLYGGPSPFTEYGPGDRPRDSARLCVLAANPDHSVQPDTGNCFPLSWQPDGAAAVTQTGANHGRNLR